MDTPRRRLRHRTATTLVAVVVLTVGACSAADTSTSPPSPSSPGASIVVTTPVTTTTTVEPDPTPTSTTAPPDTTAIATPPSYTLPPTTVPLPQPVPPPVDDEASEPVVELGTIDIPAIDIARTLYEGIRLPTFDLGPGHWPGTAMPGQIGNMVIGGHRTSRNADFRRIDRLQPGDTMTVTDTTGAAYTYRVDSTEITDPFATRIVYQTPARTATLFACHPPGSVTQRVVVHLTLIA